MERLNEVHIETQRGLRSVELVHGDICDMNEASDILVVSAFSTSYDPTKGTLVGALQQRFGLSVAKLAERPQIDLVEPLGCWVSEPLSGLPFRRLLCVLGVDTRSASTDQYDRLEQRIRDVFKAVAVVEAWDESCRTVVMPLLGAGSQGLDPAKAAAAIIRAAQSMLEKSLGLKRVRIIEYDWEKAKLLGDALDTELGRTKLALGESDVAKNVRQMLAQQLERFEGLEDEADNLMSDLAKLLAPNITARELGIWCRHFLEFVVHQFPGGPSDRQEWAKTAEVIERYSSPASRHLRAILRLASALPALHNRRRW